MSAPKLLDRLRAIQAEKLVADVVARQYSETRSRDDVEAVDLLDRATKNGRGGDRKSEEIKGNIVTFEKKPKCNSEAAALRRLRKDAPEIVTAAELLAAQKRIKPALRKELSAIDLNELALTLAIADKRDRERTSDVYRPARDFHPATVYQSAKAKESYP
jgi:hypothetical protein